MKLKHFILAACASVLLGTEASAASAYGFDAVTNEELFSSTLLYLRSMQSELLGEPIYFMTQNLMLELEAAHSSKPFAWLGQVHRFLNLAENMYPAALGHPSVGVEDKYDRIRRALLRLRDYPMHEVSDVPDSVSPEEGQAAAFHAANKQWLHQKRNEFFQFLSSPRPTGGEMQVFKIYSSGVVFRTRGACIGIDITYAEGIYDGERREELAQALDVIYVTHAHGDHYDIPLLKRMLDLGKSVVAPYTMEKHLTAYSGYKDKTLFLWDDDGPTSNPLLIQKVARTQAFRSMQNPEPLLLYLIQIDDWRIIHVGDNSEHDKEAAYAQYDMADVVVAPVFQGLTSLCGSTYIAANPGNIDQIYINIHENEWHHTIDHRVPFNYMYNNAGALGNSAYVYPAYIATECGESFTLYK